MITIDSDFKVKLEDHNYRKNFIENAIEEYQNDGNIEMFLLSMHYLIETIKNPIDIK